MIIIHEMSAIRLDSDLDLHYSSSESSGDYIDGFDGPFSNYCNFGIKNTSSKKGTSFNFFY